MSMQKLTEIVKTEIQESFTKYVGTISSDHAYIHKGLAFTGIVNTGSINAAYHIAFTTPTVASGKYIHWRPIGIDSSADYVDYTLREGDTFTGGTSATPINRNRLSSNTTGMQSFAYNATSAPTGTIIQRGGIGNSGNAFSRAGGGAGADEELVLKQNTTYILTLDPDGSTICNLSLFWYEEGEGIDA